MARARIILPMVALAIGLGLVTPARADDRVDAIAGALRADPVFVSSATPRSVPRAQVAGLRRAVSATGFPVFVVIAPSFSEEPGLATLRALPDLLHDQLERDGIYLVVDLGSTVYAQAFGVEPRFALEELSHVRFRDRPDARPGEAARYALALLNGAGRAPVPRRQPDDDSVHALPVVAAGIGAGGLGFTVAGWPWLVARRRRRLERAHAASLQSGPAAPPLDARALRDQVRGELGALSAALAGAERPPEAAFDGYAAASKLLEDAEEDDALAVLAALEISRRAEAELRGRPRAPCFFDPRHGAGETRTRWRLQGEETDIPACRQCARRIDNGQAPATVQDRDRPYFERDTLWARTGFGAIDDSLPARVLAGEARG